MDIVHVASELAPVAKAGGLGDVLYGLSCALLKKGHHVTVILPKYRNLNQELFPDLKQLETIEVEEKEAVVKVTIWSTLYQGIELVLIDPHNDQNYFDRDQIYGYDDDPSRFLFFCKAASQILTTHPPRIVHLHDWPTASCAIMLKGKVKTLLTIHCLEHQGRCTKEQLEQVNLPIDPMLQDPSELDTYNLLRGGIHHADKISTVSPSYAQEILTPQEGCHLEEDLQQHTKQLKGILNGIDPNYWNPETDPHLAKTYTANNVQVAKAINKVAIQKHFGLAQDPNRPLVTSITRLVPQKGPDLIEFGIEKTIELGGQFVLLGSAVSKELQIQFEELSNHEQVAIHLEYDEKLSHQLFAACDMLLMPSIFEPCGLTQMIAMRYGTIPLVRRTGGLKDTVTENINGFTFDIPDNKGVATVLEHAFSVFQTDQWQQLIQQAMETDWSWDASADKYVALYEDA